MVHWFFINVQNVLYLHLIRNSRLKSISSLEWYLLITARLYHFWCKNIRTTFFPWQHSTASPVHSFIMGIPTGWECNTFDKIRNLFSAVMYTLINNWCVLYITKIDLVGFFSLLEYLYSALFFSFHTTWSHNNKAVQQVVPLIATHINDKALIIILKKIKLQCKKDFKNVGFSPEKVTIWRNKSKPHATILRNKYTVFSMCKQ